MKFGFTIKLKDKRKLKYVCDASNKLEAEKKARDFQDKIEGRSMATPRGAPGDGFYANRACV